MSSWSSRDRRVRSLLHGPACDRPQEEDVVERKCHRPEGLLDEAAGSLEVVALVRPQAHDADRPVRQLHGELHRGRVLGWVPPPCDDERAVVLEDYLPGCKRHLVCQVAQRGFADRDRIQFR